MITGSIFLLLIFFLCAPFFLLAHGGRVDSSGGHYDRTTGSYHFHGSEGGSPKKSPPMSLRQSAYPSPYKRSNLVIAKTKKPKNSNIHSVKLSRVIDGDTIEVIKNGGKIKVRLYGIDCPEDGQAFGGQAKKIMQQITFDRNIKIKIIDYDKYGRAVAVVYVDNKNANEAMLKGGYAWVYTKYCKADFCNDWKAYEQKAQKYKKGLWQQLPYEPPWEWRRK